MSTPAYTPWLMIPTALLFLVSLLIVFRLFFRKIEPDIRIRVGLRYDVSIRRTGRGHWELTTGGVPLLTRFKIFLCEILSVALLIVMILGSGSLLGAGTYLITVLLNRG